MRTVFMGTPDFAVGALRALVNAGHEVAAVVTQPDKPKGRKHELTPPPVKAAAMEEGIPVLQPARVRAPEFIEELKKLQPEIIIVAAFGQIIPGAVLELPKYGCINIHASLLPKYRGAAPIQWAILDGEKESGVTLMRMDEGLDTGDMVAKVVVPITPQDTGGSLFDKLSKAGAELLVRTLPLIEKGEVRYEKQPEESPTAYARMMTKETGRMDWSMTAEELERRVRGLYPWPGTWTSLEGKQLKIWGCRLSQENPGGGCGELFVTEAGRLLVQTGEGCLEILELQLEGKRRMRAADFLRGSRLAPGTVLGA